MEEDTCVINADFVKSVNPYKLHSLFDVDAFKTLTKGIKIASCVRPKTCDDFLLDDINKGILSKIQDLAVSETLSCSFCSVNFDDKSQQRQHYKLDWHRYNLKQNLEGKKPVTEEKFDQLADDVSSISGSDTEEEDLRIDSLATTGDETPKTESSSIFLSGDHLRQPKIFFENEDGDVISLYRCVLHGKKDIPEKENQLISLALQSQIDPMWAVVMLGGGHFAAAIFEGDVAVAHKTFHCYTVRAHQGGAQGSRDSKSATNHPKSAGASLRRYNEASLVQHVQEIMQGWAEQLAKCSRIFWRAAGPHNQGVLFGGKTPPLVKFDLRLRSIPFPTRRPTFFEVQRVHKTLSSLEIYGRAEDFVDKFPVSPRSNLSKREKKPYNSASNDSNKENSESNKAIGAIGDVPSPKKSAGGRIIDRAKARRSPVRPLPEIVQALAKESPESSGNEGEEYKIVVPTLESFEKENLTEYEDTVAREIKNQIAEKKRGNKNAKSAGQKKASAPNNAATVKSDVVMMDAASLKLVNDIREACQSGDVDLLSLYIASTRGNKTESVVVGSVVEENEALKESDTSSSDDVLKKIQGYVFEDGFSVVHAASSYGHPDIVRLLLESGFDPAVKNKKGQSPYAVAANKETRNTFRRFMAKFPDKYDYNKAQVPGPLTEELEKELEAKAAEKKKLARKTKREKEKVKKKEEEERKEKERFLNLSEREKRALAAERRILERSMRGGGKAVVIFRCYQCAVDITGKVPFEYDTFKFCTMNCLKEHRAKTKPSS